MMSENQDISKVESMTQAQYDALLTIDANTL